MFPPHDIEVHISHLWYSSGVPSLDLFRFGGWRGWACCWLLKYGNGGSDASVRVRIGGYRSAQAACAFFNKK